MTQKTPKRKPSSYFATGCLGSITGGCGAASVPLVIFIKSYGLDDRIKGPFDCVIPVGMAFCEGAVVGSLFTLFAAFLFNLKKKSKPDDEIPPIAAP